jgi:hypothetical protein
LKLVAGRDFITVQNGIGTIEVVRLALRGASGRSATPTHQCAKVVVICYYRRPSGYESEGCTQLAFILSQFQSKTDPARKLKKRGFMIQFMPP